MKLLFIFITFMVAAIFSSAGAWEPEYIGVTGTVQNMQRIKWVGEHSHQRPEQYLDPIGAILEKEGDNKIDKSGEKYSFQMAVNKINQGRPNVGR